MSGPAPSVLRAGLRGLCPRCGIGPLFAAYLKIAPSCSHCQADFRAADSGDGPAFFVMFLVGALAVPFAFVLNFGLGLGPVISLGVVAILAIGFCLMLLPPAKAILFALQWHNRRDGQGP